MNREHILKEIKEWIKVFSLAFIIFIFVNIFVVNVRVNGESMLPTYQNNDLLIVNRNDKMFNYDDVVVFRHKFPQGEDYFLIKRVIGKPGDLIEIKNNRVYRNGQILNQTYTLDGITNGNIQTKVSPNHYFLMGDNRLHSIDSRFEEVGQISESDILGSVVLEWLDGNFLDLVFDKIGG